MKSMVEHKSRLQIHTGTLSVALAPGMSLLHSHVPGLARHTTLWKRAEKAAKPDHTILIQLSLPTQDATDEANAVVTGVADISATATSQE